MACTFRVASAKAKRGLPEIKLGLIPGYGGTQRLPRLIGEARALEMIMTGRSVKEDEVERMGLEHRVVEQENLMDEGKAFERTFTGYSLTVLEFRSEEHTSEIQSLMSHSYAVSCLHQTIKQ